MKEIKDTTYDEMIHAWLKSESFRLTEQGLRFDKKLIYSPDFLSNSDNEKRRQLLMCRRNGILNKIPRNTEWKIVEISKEDVNNIFIIPVDNWFLDTGKTFKLQSAFKEISPSGNHVNVVNHILHHWKTHSDVVKDETIIMIGITKNGPFTIIDGTHRAVAFERINNGYPWQAFCGISKSMINCGWHIESPLAKNNVIEFHQKFASDKLW